VKHYKRRKINPEYGAKIEIKIKIPKRNHTKQVLKPILRVNSSSLIIHITNNFPFVTSNFQKQIQNNVKFSYSNHVKKKNVSYKEKKKSPIRVRTHTKVSATQQW